MIHSFIWCLDSDHFDENPQNLSLIASILDHVSLAYVLLLYCYRFRYCSFCSQGNQSLHLLELLTTPSLCFLLLLALDTRSGVPKPEYKQSHIRTNKTEAESHLNVIEWKRETAEFSHPWRDFQHNIPFHEVLSHKLQIAANCCSIVEHLWT